MTSIIPFNVPLPMLVHKYLCSHGRGGDLGRILRITTMAHAPYNSSSRRTETRQLLVPDTQSHLPELLQTPLSTTNVFWAAAATSPLPEGPASSSLLAISGHAQMENGPATSVRCSGQEGLAELQWSSVFHRNMSSQSLEQPLLRHESAPFQLSIGSPSENSVFNSELSSIQSDGQSMRRVFSTGDLQLQIMYSGPESGSSLGLESFVNGVQKVARYNAEEKKERIQRYRSKRNQRNFNKKITYACRKTLANSRPRVRGRFVRNEEQGDNSAQIHCNQIEDDDDDENWIHLLDGNYTQVP